MHISFRSTFLRTAAALLIATAAYGAESDNTQRKHRLQTGVERAESLRSVKRLQYAFSQFQEAGLWNDLADLFTTDATGEVISGKTTVELVTGRDAVKAYWMKRA